MAIVNLSPDSFFAPSRVWTAGSTGRAFADAALARIRELTGKGASIIDLGAVSTRPGAAPVPPEEEWNRLEPVLASMHKLRGDDGSLPFRVSVDTTRSGIVRRASVFIDDLIVNDISAGEDDPLMLRTAALLGLSYIAMHKRGTPLTMDSLTGYPDGVVPELLRYFEAFSVRAEAAGLGDWILDPGLGFAKTPEQCWEILGRLEEFKVFGRPVLIGAADKRFTKSVPQWVLSQLGLAPGTDADGTDIANALAVRNGASILRVHRI